MQIILGVEFEKKNCQFNFYSKIPRSEIVQPTEGFYKFFLLQLTNSYEKEFKILK